MHPKHCNCFPNGTGLRLASQISHWNFLDMCAPHIEELREWHYKILPKSQKMMVENGMAFIHILTPVMSGTKMPRIRVLCAFVTEVTRCYVMNISHSDMRKSTPNGFMIILTRTIPSANHDSYPWWQYVNQQNGQSPTQWRWGPLSEG